MGQTTDRSLGILLVTRMRHPILVNRSHFPDETLESLVEFLTPHYKDLSMPLRITFESKVGMRGTRGRAYWPTVAHNRRVIKPGEYAIKVVIGTGRLEYPWEGVYKETAGAFTYQNLHEQVLHTIAHELRHVEQFDAFKRAKEAKAKSMGYPTGYVDIIQGFAIQFSTEWEKKVYPRGSCEIDAEYRAHAMTEAFRKAGEILDIAA